MTETRYLVPPGADWAVWDDANAVLTFMTDAEAIATARENERQLGAEFAMVVPGTRVLGLEEAHSARAIAAR